MKIVYADVNVIVNVINIEKMEMFIIISVKNVITRKRKNVIVNAIADIYAKFLY